MGTRHLKPGDHVRLLRDIHRIDETPERNLILYACKGEKGVIEEIFRPSSSSGSTPSQLCAKVRSASTNTLKTFRITSFEVL